MPLPRLVAVPCALLALACAPTAASADLTAPETLLLDTYSPEWVGYSGPVGTSEPLTAGVTYAAEVRGTYSRYHPSLMAGRTKDHLLCGRPEPEPQTPSPGRPPSRVGVDAEFLFARVAQKECFTDRPAGFFQMNIGQGFSHPTANGAPFTSAAPGHAYTYVFTGRGVPASFRVTDSQTRDNNGVFTIVVRPATPAQAAGATPNQSPSSAGASAGVSDIIAGSPRRSCASRRRFRIHIRSTRKDPIRAATVRVNGKTVKVLTRTYKGRKRKVSTVDLRGLPSGRARVDISARYRSGKLKKGVRRYYTCKPKRKSGPPKL